VARVVVAVVDIHPYFCPWRLNRLLQGECDAETGVRTTGKKQRKMRGAEAEDILWMAEGLGE
jgi:hypothetical protein